jgi:hypothetical protein
VRRIPIASFSAPTAPANVASVTFVTFARRTPSATPRSPGPALELTPAAAEQDVLPHPLLELRVESADQAADRLDDRLDDDQSTRP